MNDIELVPEAGDTTGVKRLSDEDVIKFATNIINATCDQSKPDKLITAMVQVVPAKKRSVDMVRLDNADGRGDYS